MFLTRVSLTRFSPNPTVPKRGNSEIPKAATGRVLDSQPKTAALVLGVPSPACYSTEADPGFRRFRSLQVSSLSKELYEKDWRLRKNVRSLLGSALKHDYQGRNWLYDRSHDLGRKVIFPSRSIFYPRDNIF